MRLTYITIILSFLLCSSLKAALVDIEVYPQKLVQGAVFLVSISGPERIQDGACRFDGQDISLFPGDVHGTVYGIGTVSVSTIPGDFPLEVKGIDCAGESFQKSMLVKVHETDFPTIHLKVAKKMSTPPQSSLARIEEEARLLKETMSQVTKRKFSGSFQRPVPGIVTCEFGTMRIFNKTTESFHTGTDFRGKKGSPVVATGKGEVVLVQDLYYAGKTVIVDHGLGIFSLYAHLSNTLVSKGDIVFKGETVGLLGATGRVTAPHLHFGIKSAGETVDAISLFNLPIIGKDAPMAMAFLDSEEGLL